MDPPAVASGSSSASSSSTSASRRNSFTFLEKPADGVSGLSSFSSFASLKSFSSSRVALLPMPVVTTAATSAIEVAKSSFRWLPRSRISLPYTPLSAIANPPSSPRLLLGNYFYRRVAVWGAALLGFLILVLVVGKQKHPEVFGFHPPSVSASPNAPNAEAVWLNYTRLDGYYNGIRTIVPIGQHHAEFPTEEDQEMARLETIAEEAAKISGGQNEKRVDGSVSGSEQTSQTASTTTKPKLTTVPTPTAFKAQPDYNSSEYLAQYYPVRSCYLDAAGLIPVPDIFAYSGVPQDQPEPLFGSHKVLGMKDDVCFERFGRYGPYGMGYSKEEGGTDQGLDTEREGSEHVWSASASGKIDYSNINWAEAQDRCFEANMDRFVAADSKIRGATEYPHMSGELQMKRSTETAAPITASNATRTTGGSSKASPLNTLQKLERIAIVVRCYAGYKWTPHALINFRALISEVSLQSGGEYDVHILLDVRDDNLPIWADAETAERFITDNIPAEFRGLVTPWSVGQMRLLYPGLNFQPVFENPSGNDIYGVYRSPHLALQHFAQQHPEYAHYWNWEMDMRFLGSYYEFFDRLGKWAESQQRRRIWDRSAKYYIPALHGSWENFTALVDAEAHEAGRPSILGEVFFAGRTATRDEERGISPLPAQGCEGAVLSQFNRTSPEHNTTTTAKPGRVFFADRNNNYTDIPEACGVGEPADLITLNPLFDSEDSGWVFANEVAGYNLDFAIPPRRTAIITASRLSRRLLFAMHEETWRLHHGMFAEMFPPSVALHRGFKAAYAPLPIYADRRWPLNAVERAFNAGPDHSSGAGRQSPFNQDNEHFHRGMTWYYNAEFAGRLWRRWLGYLQPIDDKKAPKPRVNSSDAMVQTLSGLGGGPGEEVRESGRMCMRSVLVHPIKFESLEEIMP